MKRNRLNRLSCFGIALVAIAVLLTACPPTTTNPPTDDTNNTDVKVTSITVSGFGGSSVITAVGQTLELNATALPADATNKTVAWSVSAGSDCATVSSSGVVSALKNGIATIRASATDGSGIFGTINITITGQTGFVRFSVQSDHTIDASHPVYVQIATDAAFTDIVRTQSYTSTETDTLLAVDAGTFYFRQFHDEDTSGTLSTDDLYNVLAEYYGYYLDSGARPAFVPKSFTVTSGNTEDIRASQIQIPQEWKYPANAGVIKISSNYTGSLGPVSSSSPLQIGIGMAPALDNFSEARINLDANTKTVYVVVPAGNFYVGGFLDSNKDSVMDKGEPRQIYNNKDLNGSTTGDTIVVTASQETAITFTMDDTYAGQTGFVQFNVPDFVSGVDIDNDHPFIVEVSPNQNFINLAYMEIRREGDSNASLEIPVGTYYFRMYHDRDNNGYLSQGDILYVHNEVRGSGITYIPKLVVVSENNTTDLTSCSLYDDWIYPANAKVLKINVAYSGALGPVSATKKLYMGVDTNTAFNSGNSLGIGFELNNQSVFCILPEGTYYVGGFLDANGNSTGNPDTGDPIQVYNGLEFNGTNGTPVDLSGGLLTEIYFNLDDTFLAL